MNSKTIIASVAGVLLFVALVGTTLTLNTVTPTTPVEAVASEPVKKAEKMVVPAMEAALEPLVCLDCHRLPNTNTNEGVASLQEFCYDCHREKNCETTVDGKTVALQITPETFNKNQERHQFTACTDCHADVARSPHKTVTGAQCMACHPVHGESTANTPHLRVSCQACHFKSEFVELDAADSTVKLSHADADAMPVSLADHALSDMEDEATCEKCHFKKNPVGAPARVLPSKSMLCILCHNAPLAMGHPIFGAAFLIFLLGIVMTLGFWYKGSVQGEEHSLHRKISLSSESIWSVLFSRQFFSLLKIFFLDIVLQRRILKESISRWSLHSLIFSAILLRFLLSVVTAVGFYFNPDSELMLALIDKNNPFTAFANDLLGLCVLIGVLWAVFRRFIVKPDHVVTENQDNVALIFIGGLVLLGFLLEAVRVVNTAIPADIAVYSFVSYPLAKIFSIVGIDWGSVYPYLWYAHAVVAVLFVAYLPFGKMRHVFNTPLTYFIEQVAGVKNEKRV